jgi:hypothetical protein
MSEIKHELGAKGNWYSSRGCRCDACKAAHHADQRLYRQRKRQAATELREATKAAQDATDTWLPVVGFEGRYEVSASGAVRSLDLPVASGFSGQKIIPGRVLRPQPRETGHLKVGLHRDGQTWLYVHRLVLEAFVGACPDGHEACHRDGDPTNNRVGNLYWGTRSQNAQDRWRHARQKTGAS